MNCATCTHSHQEAVKHGKEWTVAMLCCVDKYRCVATFPEATCKQYEREPGTEPFICDTRGRGDGPN